MTAAVFRNTPSLSIPRTQNTAKVLDFDCLYTHDVRKKTKKWQDGYLRFHTFNKRIMVYDMPRNFVGDTHWTNDEAVTEGDKITLQDGAVKVEVGNSRGQTETDLSELRTSRKKPAPMSDALSGRVQTPTIRQTGGSSNGTRAAPPQIKHRSLNALLGTPKGPIGKATLPQTSPFEERHQAEENQEWEDGRPPKRMRREDNSSCDVTRTAKAPKGSKTATTVLSARKVGIAKQRQDALLLRGQQRLSTKEVIDLSDDVEPPDNFLPGFSSDALAPPSPDKERSKSAAWPCVRSSSPAFQTQQAQPPTMRREHTSDQRGQASTELASQQRARAGKTASRESIAVGEVPLEASIPPSRAFTRDGKARVESGLTSSSHDLSKAAKLGTGPTLRLAVSAPKKRTLLCQDQMTKKAKASTSSTAGPVELLPDYDIEGRPGPASRARQQLEARLAKIDRKRGSTSSSKINAAKAQLIKLDVDSKTEGHEDAVHCADENAILARPQTSHAASAIEIGRLDEMILPGVKAASVSPRQPRQLLPSKGVANQEAEREPLRRTVSYSNNRTSTSKRIPGAPVRYIPTPTSSPAKRSVPPPGDVANESSRPSKQNALLQKSVSLNVTSAGMSKVILGKPLQQLRKAAESEESDLPKDIGPWSREAFDLFAWRPPNWDEEKWCVKSPTQVDEAPTAAEGTARAPPAGLSGGVSLPHA